MQNAIHEALPPYSVLMSVYQNDRPEWVEIAVESMTDQSWPPQEIVIVEDGEIPTLLAEKLKELTRKHTGLIKLLVQPVQKGLAEAMKEGVPQCSCEWIARMDADDYSMPDRCEEELRLAIDRHADIVGCDCAEFEENIENIRSYRVFPTDHSDIVRFSKRRTPFCHPAVMMKKSAVLKAGNYQKCDLLEDYDLFVRMLASGAVGCSTRDVLYYVRVNPGFYGRRGGIRYIRQLLRFNLHLLKIGWTSPRDCFTRSCANIVVGLVPVRLRAWIYRRLLRK